MKERSIVFEKLSINQITDDLVLAGIEKCTLENAHSHSPYSNFKVVACLVFSDGETVVAANQENVAFPSGICAEANVISYAGSKFPKKTPKAVVVRAYDQDENEVDFISPCGNCRQVLIEYEHRQKEPVQVLFGSENAGFYRVKSCEDLLPLFFSPDSLQ